MLVGPRLGARSYCPGQVRSHPTALPTVASVSPLRRRRHHRWPRQIGHDRRSGLGPGCVARDADAIDPVCQGYGRCGSLSNLGTFGAIACQARTIHIQIACRT